MPSNTVGVAVSMDDQFRGVCTKGECAKSQSEASGRGNESHKHDSAQEPHPHFANVGPKHHHRPSYQTCPHTSPCIHRRYQP